MATKRAAATSVLAILISIVSGAVAVGAFAPPAAAVGCQFPLPPPDDDVIKIVYQVGRQLDVSDKVMLSGFEAGVVESNMNNLNCGDKDSLGVFQQRPSQGWGTPEQIRDVNFASNSYFTRAVPAAAANPGYTAGQVAQAVQRSCCPSRYDAVEATARALMARAASLQTPQRAVGSPVVVYGDSVQVFGAGTNPAKSLYQRAYRPGTGWLAWANVGGSILGRPAVVRFGDDLHAFARGVDNKLWQRLYRPGSGWSGWVDLGGALASDPAVLVDGGTVQVYAVGTDPSRPLWQRVYRTGHGWGGWTNLGGQLAGRPSVVTYGDSVQVFIRGTDNAIYQRAYAPGAGWQPWASLGGQLSGDPATLVDGPALHVYAAGTDPTRPLFEKTYQQGRWSAWTNHGGGVAGRPSIVKYGDSVQVYTRGLNGALYQRAHTPGAGWQPWANLGGQLTGDPTTIVNDNTLQIYAVTTDNSIWQKVYRTGHWDTWHNLGGSLQE